ncbi:SRPBCC family protein [Constantimarinum furrinae]|uniref:Polyketide cyclase n=1 Tax=Constantimarinum furrinae TaxID=2562285 RepID=A0A7G8PW23_9FLAO|nr:SRPBCC family protein [Constantimarinum furrinae]QNJ98539.1 polyketide cyclase [Constantimarinum furrinae]
MILVYIFAVLIGIIMLLMLVAPRKYDVQRSIVVNRPLNEVFQYLKMIKNQDEWSPWKSRDPEMKQTFEGVDGTVGFVARWESDKKDVGVGEQELKGLIENERVDTEIRFLKPWKTVSDGYLLLRAIEPSKTEVIWGFKGNNNPPINVMMLFYNMDKSVGKDFDEGLAKLKATLEK